MAFTNLIPLISTLLLSSFLLLSHGLIDQNQTFQSMIIQACDKINNQDSCLSNLQSHVESHGHHTSLSVLRAALQNTLNEAMKAIDSITKFNTLSISYREQLAINDCKELLDFSVSELAWSLSEMNKIRSGFKNPQLEGNLKAWLSAALSNQDTCLEGFEGTDRRLEHFVKGSLEQVTQLIGNVLTLYTQMHSLPFRPPRNNNATYTENGNKGFPKWMSDGDKDFLVSGRKGMHVDSVVALDGSGDYRSIGQAIYEAPTYSKRRYVIYVKKGVYQENIDMKKKKTNIMLLGDGIGRTVITGNRNFMQGWTTFRTATVAVSGKGFIARDITFRNTAGPQSHQGVALRVDSDQSAFYRCSIEGHQDTLYAHSLRQFYRECTISGTIDFIFGNGAAVLQNCKIFTLDPLPLQKITITAQGRKDPHQSTGFSIQDSYIYANKPTYLGRPWKMYSRTVFMNTYMSKMVQPRGWLEWYGDFALGTLWYGEYKNYGPGSSVSDRVRWPGYHVISDASTASLFSVGRFIDGMSWLPGTGIRFSAAMVVALTVTSLKKDKSKGPDVSASQKAITNICQTTDYEQACVESLKSAANDTTDPKKLIELAFEAAMKHINDAVKNSTVLEQVQKDQRGKAAFATCRDLANRAVHDLKRSFNKFNTFDITYFDNMLSDLKIWLSGAITYQETCLDGFEGVPGDSGEKMRDALKMAMEMTSNALAMVAEIATFLESMGGSQNITSRRLLSERLPVMGHNDDFPDWMEFNKRKLLNAPPEHLKIDLIVAKDGSGKYRTINEALKEIPRNSNRTFVLHIKEGIYQEKVHIDSTLTKLFMIGDGPTKTRITGKLNYKDGSSTFNSATVAVEGDHFIARDIGFENSAGPIKEQAVALRVSADLVIFYNCHMDGYQDTLYAHTYRQYYRDCVISGTIDFIFGDSAAVFQGCTLLFRKPLGGQECIATAQGRTNVRQPTGFVLQNCTFKADPEFQPLTKHHKSYLGRPWRQFSRTIIMESFLDDLIQPLGWVKWPGESYIETLFYVEFNNRGPAAPKAEREKWPGIKELPSNRVQRFTAAEFIDGTRWIAPTKVPYNAEFIFPVPKDDPNIKYSPVVPEENKDLGSAKDKAAYVNTPPDVLETPATPPPPPPTTDSTPPQPSNNSETPNTDNSPPSDESSPSIPISGIAGPPETSHVYADAPALSPVSQPTKFTSNKLSVLKLYFRGV
ncbi:hypothetical protein BUALT_Bualt19G0066700 [Buddleja alternifolia]|uniref:pectinesterase n=1 Tax=Buddleja alternifolia TaxID=168488 RepID=A0AAV6W5Z7_9LAMI|nr:hypothetical protein BUALT_Bualt19G0066700 [Buddleja alternifolia]